MKTMTIALVLASAFLLLAACGGEPTSPSPTAVPATLPAAPTAIGSALPNATAPRASGICAPGSAPAFLKAVVLAQDVEGDQFAPVDVTEEFTPEQGAFHAVVSLERAPANTRLRAVWYLVNAEGYQPNTMLDENELTVTDGGTRNVDFRLESASGPWPPGAYCVEIYTDGNLARSNKFRVVGSGAPSPSGANPVTQVVLAEDTQPETFEPVNPTTTFKRTAPYIHAAVRLENAPPNTMFRARWYPPAQDPLDFTLTADGTRWLDFRLTRPSEGFPTGEYDVEIYVNDQWVETKTFTVE